MPSSLIPAVDLGTAGNYVILAKAGISTVPASVITGDIAVSPITGTAMTGFSETSTDGTAATSDQVVDGFLYGADYLDPTPGILTTAVSNMETAYTDAAGRSNSDATRIDVDNGELDGETEPFTPGVYTFGVKVSIDEKITFRGGSDDVFIMQITKELDVASGVKVILECDPISEVLNGCAKAENIFWQVAEAVTVGTGAHMEGNILGFTGVSFNTGSSLNGGIYAQTAVTLQQATITQKPTSS